MTKKYNISTKFLDNKSRKGYYVYIWTKGQRASYYKIQEGVPIDAYVNYYQDRVDKRRKIKGTKREYEQIFRGQPVGKAKVSKSLKAFVTKKYAKSIKSKQSISKGIEKGITSYTLPNALTASDGDVRQAYRELLKPLVLDKGLLNVLTLEENIQKLAKRFEFKSILRDMSGNSIGEFISHTGSKSLRQVVNDIQENFKEGMTTEQIYMSKKRMGTKKYTYKDRESKKDLKDIIIEMFFRY